MFLLSRSLLLLNLIFLELPFDALDFLEAFVFLEVLSCSVCGEIRSLSTYGIDCILVALDLSIDLSIVL